ncbi:DUF6509 family protein [Caryophanon tenue]|uniref:Pullulanase n=1 Tax=Caryophanon tenue TaxID=33978 RepID=A0A1C0YHG2_9BACL|nr:DUF6509 family protein [Caryophanon tenue]OCS86615.1 pullulanase [Caryophanon tenue]
MEITQYSVEQIKDPTNIIEGKRYEFLIDVDIDEEDELYREMGIEIRVIIGELDGVYSLKSYFLIDKADQSFLDFALDEDEEAEILAFCQEELTRPNEEA